MCFVFIWEQTAICATYSINWLVFITEIKSVYCAVRTGSLSKAVCASSLKGQCFLEKQSCSLWVSYEENYTPSLNADFFKRQSGWDYHHGCHSCWSLGISRNMTVFRSLLLHCNCNELGLLTGDCLINVKRTVMALSCYRRSSGFLLSYSQGRNHRQLTRLRYHCIALPRTRRFRLVLKSLWRSP